MDLNVQHRPAATSLPARVVLYHRVGRLIDDGSGEPSDVGGMITPRETLEAHIELLQGLGYRFATASELASLWRRRIPPPGIAVLTFDDGWRDAVITVAPLLNRLGLRATFFICPGGFGNHHARLGDEGTLITEAEARALHDAGMELASHSVSHPDLRECSDSELQQELVGSREAVEAITGERCLTLAYPTGLRDPRVERAAADAGYQLAFACRSGPWRRYAVPRVQPPTKEPAALIRRLELVGGGW